jgi:hypothetical protein
MIAEKPSAVKPEALSHQAFGPESLPIPMNTFQSVDRFFKRGG